MHVENALKMILTTIVKGLEIMKFTKKWLAPGLDQRFISKLTPSSHNLAYCSICWLRKCIVIIP